MNYFNPVKIYLNEEEILKLLNYSDKKYLLIAGQSFLEGNSFLNKIKIELNRDLVVYSGIKPNPDIKDLLKIKRETDYIKYDEIVAIGGGSVLDVGKALAALRGVEIGGEEELRNIIVKKSYRLKNIKRPFLGISTTSGTGSEVTSWATIWDEKRNKKYSIEDDRLYYENILVYPQITKTLPKDLTAITMLDALSHAVESYWAISSNILTRNFSIKSIELIIDSGKKLLKDLDNIKLRSDIAYASLYAGLAFSNTKTTACHSISYPLTNMFKVPHGIATSISLYEMVKLNHNSIVDINAFKNAFRVKEMETIDKKIKEIYTLGGLEYKLSKYGIKKSDIPNIVEESYTPERMNNNPIEITEEMLKEILQKIY